MDMGITSITCIGQAFVAGENVSKIYIVREVSSEKIITELIEEIRMPHVKVSLEVDIILTSEIRNEGLENKEILGNVYTINRVRLGEGSRKVRVVL